MKIKLAIFFFLCISFVHAQNEAPKVISLYPGKVPGSENWDWQEAAMCSDVWQTEVVYNVVTPSLTAYLPAWRNVNGTAVVVCSVLPAYDFPWRPGLEPAGKMIALNGMIEDFAEKNNIYYLDYYSALADTRNGMQENIPGTRFILPQKVIR